jgi:hypothetical protein
MNLYRLLYTTTPFPLGGRGEYVAVGHFSQENMASMWLLVFFMFFIFGKMTNSQKILMLTLSYG